MNLYYKIWVDAIVKIRENPLRQEDWKWMVQIYMGIAMAIDFAFIMAILQRNIFHYNFYNVNLTLFQYSKLNSLVSFFLLFFLPSLIINYLLIFKGKKYEVLTKKYKSNNGKLFITYFMISIFTPLFILLIAFFLR